jgi:hypothetical protein
MPTLARLLLVCASLLLGPLVVMADELPKDTNKITSLTVEQAQRLAETFPGVVIEVTVAKEKLQWSNCLPLNALKNLGADVARSLAGYSKGPLSLDGLTTLSDEAAKALAQHTGLLELDGLTTLDADTAKALAQHEGWDGQLPNLTALDSPDSVAIAQALATRKGLLALPNLKKISPKTLTALIEKWDVEIPLIETLELIPEPDGSPNDDFTIPEWLEELQKRPRQKR